MLECSDGYSVLQLAVLYVQLLLALRANLHFTLWMCIADDSSKVKGIKAVFIRISSKVTSEQRANLHFTLWMCIADDSSKVKGVKAVFIRISSKVNIQSDQ